MNIIHECYSHSESDTFMIDILLYSFYGLNDDDLSFSQSYVAGCI
jgi:hypothetical protein